MVIHELTASPGPELERALKQFEAAFTFPYDDGRTFRVVYGSDRTAFIRTMGEGRCYIAESEGEIVGLLEMAVVNLLQPDGTEIPAVYVADIKLLPKARKTMVMGRLLQTGVAWGRTQSKFWFTLALDGTPIKPPDYTGRIGIGRMTAAGRVTVVRLPVPASGAMREGDERFIADPAEGKALFRKLARGRYALPSGMPVVRSETPPAWLVHPSGLACARFEDRRKVRRLIANDGSELRPAYLSCFAFQEPRAALELIAIATRRAGALGFRALRMCPPESDAEMLKKMAGGVAVTGVGGTVFAVESAVKGAIWCLNASEV